MGMHSGSASYVNKVGKSKVVERTILTNAQTAQARRLKLLSDLRVKEASRKPKKKWYRELLDWVLDLL